MALIKCNECGHMISDRATKCPKCGCPITKESKPHIHQETPQTQPFYYDDKNGGSSRKWLYGIIALLVALIAGGGYWWYIHSYDLTQASVHDLKYVNDIGQDFFQCTIIGDKGYLSAEVQLNLFESAYIRLEVPYRLNQKNWKPFYKPFGKVRKRVETDFSQFTDQFNIMRNYAKQHVGFFTRIISKVSAFTVSQYLNSINNRPIGRIKYALA